ncbi:enoyl-CoA hydratase/isomerase family protein [Leeuwenhoekiella sp. A16]|uniref:enoyl-CoA hydratase/isomerase family protein n=1 Tax=unclassified Leeuwenhoekiella TaxID=2615029 RepID=UPI000C5933BD|nr:enoyl-CoA hydratase [Pseudooceanicola sp.]|tara:strand:- start:965 stop:1747 length:783 start_codon:yes stop_codon:yes gene_type:complete
MSFQNLQYQEEDNFVLITIDRPKKLNALNKETIQELHDAFAKADNDPETRFIILTGSGEKAFVAGADISEFSDFNTDQGSALAQEGQELLFDFVENLGTPVIAAINGFALGGGLELAMAAHFRIASDNAKMGLPEVSLGLIPGYGGTQRLPQLVGKGRAMEMIFTAAMIDANQALQYGLINHVTAQEGLIPLAEKIGAKITANSGVAIKAAIEAINAGFGAKKEGFSKEIEAFGNSFGTADFKEGTSAFLEKRKADFPGE